LAKLNNNLIKLLQNTSKWHLWLAAVFMAMLLTLPIVSGMEFLLLGKVTVDYVITGLVASIAVASVVSGLTIQIIHLVARMRLDIDQLNAFIEACPVPIILNDDKDNILQVNPEFSRVFGYALEDIPTLNDWWPNACPDAGYRRSVMGLWRRQLQENRVKGAISKPLEVKVRCKNGVSKDVVIIDTHLVAPYEGIQLVALYDDSESVAMANALTESRNILQSVIEMIPMRVFWKGRDFRYLGCNTAFAMDAGEASPAGVIGKQDTQFPWKEQADLYRADDQRVLETGVSKLTYDEPQTAPDGHRIWLRTSKVPLPDDRGNVIGVLGVYEDISERKKIETELWLTKTILDKSKTAFFRHSPDGMVQYVNEFACESLGYTREELVGMYPWDFDPDFPSTVWPGFWEKLRRVGVVNLDSRHRRKDGTIFNIEVTAHYISDSIMKCNA
jgi:PAS domain S-box-containing protein